MRAKILYMILKGYRSILGIVYRGFKKMVRYLSYHHNHLGCTLEAIRLEMLIPKGSNGVEKSEVNAFKAKWRPLSEHIPAVYIRMYPHYSGVMSADYVPDSLFYTHIEPMLNNLEYSRSFADKNMYARLIEKSVLSLGGLRKIHGTYLDHDYNSVSDVEAFISGLADRFDRMMLKPSIESQGGRSVVMLESRDGAFFSGNEKVTREWLDKHYKDNFLFQELVEQHPSYAAFNPTSVNTLRITTYRSVIDESVHVLHGLLRVGTKGDVVDNVTSGGKACGVSSEGALNGKVIDYKGRSYPKLGSVLLEPGKKLFKYQEVVDVAKKLAAQQVYSRFLGFDFSVDKDERVVLIEINNFDVGINTLQFCNGPLFGPFTDEVLAYCVSKKPGFRYQIR